MKKYIVTAKFQWSEEIMELIPEHRKYINKLIEDEVIEHYAVSMEAERVWITINAKTKVQVRKILSSSPLYKMWKLDVNELMAWDGQTYRLPAVQLN
jgi:hypothetical protein